MQKHPRIFPLRLIVLGLLFISGVQGSATRLIKVLTGLNTSSSVFGVGGTDLGMPVRQPDGNVAYIFGDTFSCDGVGCGDWRAPVLLRSSPGLHLEDGILFNGAAGGNYAKQLFPYSHSSPLYSTWLPSAALTIGTRMYLHIIINRGLGVVQWTQMTYSDDNGENWVLSNATWAPDDSGGLRQLWTMELGTDGYVYCMSTSFISRSQPIIMYRVPASSLLQPASYQPWGYQNGQWAWGNPASVILTGKFGELSLRTVQGKWVLSWFNAGDYDITVKVFDSPTSNLYEAPTFKPITGTMVPQLYGGYIHPDSTLEELVLIVSQWDTATNWPYWAMQWVTCVQPTGCPP